MRIQTRPRGALTFRLRSSSAWGSPNRECVNRCVTQVGGGLAAMQIAAGESLAQQHVGKFTRPYHARQPVVERRKSAESQALPGRSVDISPCSKGWAGLVVDGLASGNHRRGRAGATLGDVYGAYRCATNSGGGWGPGHTGNVGTAHTSRLFASGRFSPRAPAPVAPPLPAQYAIRRDRSDGTALSPRRSTPPANPAPR